MSNNKKTVKVKFVDFHKGFDVYQNDIYLCLKEKYDVILSDQPDYLVYSVFGLEHLNYDCIRIFYTGECYTPNFNECDYAIGFDRFEFEDRYIRIPIYRMNQYKNNFLKLFNRKPFTKEELDQKKGFCSFVYSNCFAQSARARMFDLLSKYKKVSSGGRYKNNIGGAIKDKDAFLGDYKFNIAFENASFKGYTTEKIVDAFAANTLPIYYGDPDVVNDFNEKAFINCNGFSSLEEAIEYVKKVDQDDELYLQMMNENPLNQTYNENELKDFLYHIFDQEYKLASRRTKSITSNDYELLLKRHQFFEKNIYPNYRKIKNQLTRIKTGTLLTNKKK